jgi:hypothetical protein
MTIKRAAQFSRLRVLWVKQKKKNKYLGTSSLLSLNLFGRKKKKRVFVEELLKYHAEMFYFQLPS